MTAKWIASLVAASLLLPAPAGAAGLFTALDGAWKGGGVVRMDSGKREKITCKGYYNSKAGGAELGVAISCANAAMKITMRAQLVDSGGKVSGTWEEREFNQSGQVTGKATDDTLSLTFAGGITGKMSIASSGSSQTVEISTGGPGFVGANLELKK